MPIYIPKPPPAVPHGSCRFKFPDAEETWAVEVIARLWRASPNCTKSSICQVLHEHAPKAPHHSVSSWKAYWGRCARRINARVKELLQRPLHPLPTRSGRRADPSATRSSGDDEKESSPLIIQFAYKVSSRPGKRPSGKDEAPSSVPPPNKPLVPHPLPRRQLERKVSTKHGDVRTPEKRCFVKAKPPSSKGQQPFGTSPQNTDKNNAPRIGRDRLTSPAVKREQSPVIPPVHGVTSSSMKEEGKPPFPAWLDIRRNKVKTEDCSSLPGGSTLLTPARLAVLYAYEENTPITCVACSYVDRRYELSQNVGVAELNRHARQTHADIFEFIQKETEGMTEEEVERWA
ncbi:hypothetical protein C8R43DRAFT_1118430 [Mycena crocata]|nr:hypothetical protein C8R43DRAFT_1118430 [Mycena crocata]